MNDVANNGQAVEDIESNEGDAQHPAGQIRVSRISMIGMRVGALAGFAMASMAMAGVFSQMDTTSSMK